jgi:hypothetical protein
MNINALKEICLMTFRLTQLRQNECKHLCIKTFAPEIFGKLIEEYNNRTNPVIDFECKACGWKSYPGATILSNKIKTKYYCPECRHTLDIKIEAIEQTFVLKNNLCCAE